MSEPAPSFWTPERSDRLVELWTKHGLSATQIAQELSEQFGGMISRNAVMGRLHRMKLPPRPARGDGLSARQKAATRQAAKARAMRPAKNGANAAAAKPRSPQPVARPISVAALSIDGVEMSLRPDASIHMTDLRHGDRRCRMPLWGRERVTFDAMRFCGETTEVNSSWCPACESKVFDQRATAKAKAQAKEAVRRAA